MITITIVIIMVWFSKVSLAEPRTSGAGQQFENGDVIVTLLPVNERFPWVTPARSAAFAHFYKFGVLLQTRGLWTLKIFSLKTMGL